jgi:hypothetical protein
MTEEKTTHNMLMELIAEECTIDASEVIEYPPTALSFGHSTIQTKNGEVKYPISLGSLGNISVITAPPKSKKSFYCSLLASIYLSGANNFGGKLRGHREGRSLIHIDTEMGHWHAARSFNRVRQMSLFKDKDSYKTFALRTIGYKERLEFLEYTLEQNKGKNGLVILDGVADLVADVNDLISCNECVAKLMKLSTIYNTHILCVIHQNFGSSKLGTGHLGSFLEKKAELVTSLELNTTNKDLVTVKCMRSRGYPFETFSFTINEFGLPCIFADIYDPLEYYVPRTLTKSTL